MSVWCNSWPNHLSHELKLNCGWNGKFAAAFITAQHKVTQSYSVRKFMILCSCLAFFSFYNIMIHWKSYCFMCRCFLCFTVTLRSCFSARTPVKWLAWSTQSIPGRKQLMDRFALNHHPKTKNKTIPSKVNKKVLITKYYGKESLGKLVQLVCSTIQPPNSKDTVYFRGKKIF